MVELSPVQAFDALADTWKQGTPGIVCGAGHEYKFEGRPTAGVTELLKAVGLNDYSHVPEGILERAQRRGQYVHLCTQFIDEGKLNWTTLDETLKGYSRAYVAFRDSVNYRPGVVEAPFYSKAFDYAGTPDRVCMINGVCGILDFKSSVTPNRDDALQTAGYYILVRENIPTIGCKKRWRLQLRADGTFRLTEFTNLEKDLRVFLASREIYAWKQAA